MNRRPQRHTANVAVHTFTAYNVTCIDESPRSILACLTGNNIQMTGMYTQRDLWAKIRYLCERTASIGWQGLSLLVRYPCRTIRSTNHTRLPRLMYSEPTSDHSRRVGDGNVQELSGNSSSPLARQRALHRHVSWQCLCSHTFQYTFA